ncbi:ParB/Srx family N-terminal domain-containing protein [Bradyrhizobium sp. 6(2017)]|uniref:ParB/Srx family N-terminal domain-containing protein n=1 Tax=Bradyrhizobium sp. 6(2017) TaxID=1197460 RepID=UPI0013E17D9C|nr:ParB/Srx family N-terminal domain-containing protein [Bradyrhizobium sp. 6(2017)]QIG93824.1 ParB N-terminal domain-containing protein [Bradyrhizobium sp. 6(2017)]
MQQSSKKGVFPDKNSHFGASEIARNWPADQVSRRPIRELVPNARNARLHSEEQIEQIAASISEWGWTIPVLIDEAGTIIAGHGRVLAAEQLGIDQVPTMVAHGWSDAQKRAYLIADNKLTENGKWDDALLRVELNDLASLGLADLTGFSETELREMGIGVEGLGGMPIISDGERSPFQQMTFILHETQAELVAKAIERASAILGPPSEASENKNQNGNALAEICRAYQDDR